jgi:hypothetical protein
MTVFAGERNRAPMAASAAEPSFIDGGPTYQLLLRMRLQHPEAPQLVRRSLVLAALTWVPLLLLSLAGGSAFGGVTLPFLHDVGAYVRFLLAVPLLVVAEIVIGPRLSAVARHFAESGLIDPAERPRYDDAIRQMVRWRDSNLAEAILLALVYSLAWFGTRAALGDGVSSWRGWIAADGVHVTAAGWWCALVSIPVLQFLLGRWLWRGFIWSRFLRRMARLPLRLVPTHPDARGGLGFLGVGQSAFGVLLLTMGVILAAPLANQILYHGRHVTDFRVLIGVFVAVAVGLVLLPLLSFRRQLVRLKLVGWLEYGALAGRHQRAFDARWGRAAENQDALLGSADVSSLADIGAGFDYVAKLGTVPGDRATVLGLAVAAALPMLPLAALEVPLKDLLGMLVKVLM